MVISAARGLLRIAASITEYHKAGPALIPRAQIPVMLERSLGQVISAQESNSWLLLCDILQYEVTPILESWKAIAQATRSAK